jgi:hypothetical protein
MITIQKVTSNVQSVPLQFPEFIDTPNCVLEDRVRYTTAHIPNYSVMANFKLSIVWGMFDRSSGVQRLLITLNKCEGKPYASASFTRHSLVGTENWSESSGIEKIATL